MSVINQMLRDLEERKLKETSSDHYIDEVNIIARRTVSPWWIILPVIITIVVAINFYLYFINNDKSDSRPVKQLGQTITESIVRDLPEKIADIKPQTVQNHVESNENTIINEAPPVNKKIEQQTASEQVSKRVTNQVRKRAEEKAAINTDKLVSEIKTEIKKQSVMPEKTLTQAVENDSQAKKQSLTVKVPSDNLHNKAKVKSSVNSQSKIVKTNTPPNAEKIMYQARLLMSDNQIAAIYLLENNINKIIPDADYYALLANLNQRRQNYDNAIIYYRKALEISPYKGEIWIGIALAYQNTGEKNNAVTAFKQALTTDDLSLELRAYARQQIGL